MSSINDLHRSKINKRMIEKRLAVDLIDLQQFPSYFLIETIFACNADCIMCPAKMSKRKKGKMPEKLILRLLDEIGEFSDSVTKVQYFLHGEPCLDRDLPKWVAQAKKRNINITHIATNGSLLDENMSVRLLDAGLDEIYIAVDGAKNRTYSSIRKGLNLPTLKNNVINFVKLRNKTGNKTKIRLLMVVQDKNADEVEDWKDFWEPILGNNDELFANRITNWGGQIDTGTFYHRPDDGLACVFPFGTMPIMADGTVPLCCEDVMPVYHMGHVNKSSIRKIWTSSKWRNICDLHLKGRRGDMQLCQGCDVFRDDKYIYNIKVKK